jgi:hypothetical protein
MGPSSEIFYPSTHAMIDNTNVIFDEILIDPTTLGEVLYVPRVGGFILGALVGDVRHTSQRLELDHSDISKPMTTYL